MSVLSPDIAEQADKVVTEMVMLIENVTRRSDSSSVANFKPVIINPTDPKHKYEPIELYMDIVFKKDDKLYHSMFTQVLDTNGGIEYLLKEYDLSKEIRDVIQERLDPSWGGERDMSGLPVARHSKMFEIKNDKKLREALAQLPPDCKYIKVPGLNITHLYKVTVKIFPYNKNTDSLNL